MGFKSAEQEAINRLAVILAHIYKFQNYRQYSQGGIKWLKTIRTQIRDLRKILEDYPSLEKKIDDLIKNHAWEKAKKLVIKDLEGDIKLSKEDFPEGCPYNWETILVYYYSYYM
ncbi:DUF29 family protein [Hydrogenobacter sp. T-2]|uniref:DUF29 family protein n=1 Tax=Pampinifervens diazotrophicum TaxID=1632018 RepID=UPI002B25FDE9|nr:DUF29 family protein [Hydrogenobacter sp. T-2]WPM32099.1 DUF29 family protein [Hydrogenobacter sp. T-2]